METHLDASKVVLPSFFDFWKARKNTRYTHLVAYGGRNSAKSTTIGQALVWDIVEFPINAVAIRRVARTIKRSCFEQIKKATIQLKIDHLFKFNESEYLATYVPRGNYIMFSGLDDPLKLKSITTFKFPITTVWFEELSEIRMEDDIQIVIDSILREKLPSNLWYRFFYSFNPAPRKSHWANKKFLTQFIPDNTFVHHSDYRSNFYLSQQTLQEIENAKEQNYKLYEWRYLGKVIGGGVVPFENLVFRKITDNEVKSFDNIRQGIDWGYGGDPFAFVRLHYDKTRRKIYFLNEIYQIKLHNRIASDMIIKNKWHSINIICDPHEPKSRDEMKSYGISISSAVGGPGSVEYGEKWLDDLNEIVIDPNRTPNVAKEFENIDYQIDKDGNLLNRLEDKDNHTIDSTRYAMERDMSLGLRFG